MSVGDHIKAATDSASHLTQRVVDAVEKKVDEATAALEGAAGATGKKIRDLAGSAGPERAQAARIEPEDADRDMSEHGADDGGTGAHEQRDRSMKPKRIAGRQPDERR